MEIFSKVAVKYNDEIDKVPVTLSFYQKQESSSFDVSAMISKRGFDSLDVTVAIMSKNTIYGKMEVVPPPLITKKFYSIKDATVREFAPHMNYGSNSSLVVGRTEEGILHSYLGFPKIDVPMDLEIENAKLVLFSQKQYDAFYSSIYACDDDWYEHTIKWNYKPFKRDFIKDFHINGDRIEIDLTQFAESIRSLESFSIALCHKDEATDSSLYFGSKESSNKPYFEVSYFEKVESAGIANLKATATIAVHDHNELECTVDILSNFVASTMSTTCGFTKKTSHNTMPVTAEIKLSNAKDFDADVIFFAKNGDNAFEVDSFLRAYDESMMDTQITFHQKNESIFFDADLIMRKRESSDLAIQSDFSKKNTFSHMDINLIMKASSEDALETNLDFNIKEKSAIIDTTLTIALRDKNNLPATCLFDKKSKADYLDVIIKLAVRDDRSMITKLDFTKKESFQTFEIDCFMRPYGDSDMITKIDFVRKDASSEFEAQASFRAYGESIIDTDIMYAKKELFNDFEAKLSLAEKRRVVNLKVNTVIAVRWAEELECTFTIKGEGSNKDFAYII